MMEKEKSKNWFAAHKILTGILAVIIGFILLIIVTPSPKKFGYTLDERKQIFAEIVTAEDKAQKEANAKYPTDPSVVTDTAKLKENVDQNAELSTNLQKQYRQEVLNKYKLTEDASKEISLEGVKANWPMPKFK